MTIVSIPCNHHPSRSSLIVIVLIAAPPVDELPRIYYLGRPGPLLNVRTPDNPIIETRPKLKRESKEEKKEVVRTMFLVAVENAANEVRGTAGLL